MHAGTKATDRAQGEQGAASFILTASMALYAVSFFLPAFAERHRSPVPGYSAFLMALLGPLFYAITGGAVLVREADPRGLLLLALFLPWLGNVAYWLAAHRLQAGRSCGVVPLGILAVLLGLSAWATTTCFWLSFPADRRGPPPITYREGYWLWLSSMALLVYPSWESKRISAGRGRL